MSTTDHDNAPVRVWIGNGDRRRPATRLGATLSGRVGPEALPHLTTPDRVAAVVGMDGMPGSRAGELLAITEPNQDVLPAVMPPRTGAPLRLLAVVALALLALLVSGVLSGDPAHAATAPRTPGVTLTLSGRSVAVRVPVPGATVAAWMQTADGGHVRLSVRRGFAVGGLPSALVRPGQSIIELDQIMGDVVRIPVVALRKSRVSAPMLTAWSDYTLVQGVVSHYDPAIDGYRGDVASPVQVQAYSFGAGRWVTLTTLTTDATGSVIGVIPTPSGLVRLVRPVGATVTGAAGVAVLVDGAGCRSARAELVYC